MRCCEAWKPLEDCFDTLSFECIDFQRICHIFASFTRENLATHETEVSPFPCTETEKDIALARCRSSHRAWRNKKPVVTLSAVTDEDRHPFQKGQSGRRLLECGELFAKHARKARGTFNMKKFSISSTSSS